MLIILPDSGKIYLWIRKSAFLSEMKLLLIVLFIGCFTVSSVAQTERLVIPWPENWKIGAEQKNYTGNTVELISSTEKMDSWTILGTMKSIKGTENSTIESSMNATFNEVKKNAINPILTLIDKKEDAKNPWILFKIEAAENKNNNTPESRLYYVVRGNDALYSNYVAIKEATLSKEFTNHWAAIFKLSKIVGQSR